MTVQDLSRDCSFVIVSPHGTESFLITEGSAIPETRPVVSRPLSEPPKFGEIPIGWSGKLTFDDRGKEIDTTAASFSVWQTVNTTDGSIVQYRFTSLQHCEFKNGPRGQVCVSFDHAQREIVK